MTDDESKKRARGAGSIYTRPDSPVLWCSYSRNGKLFRESTHTTDPKKAAKFLQRRLAEIITGTFTPPKMERVRVSELAEDVNRYNKINNAKSAADVKARFDLHVLPFFGHLRAADVSTALIARYVDERQSAGAADATVNRELAALKRAFKLGMQCTPRKVLQTPHFGMLRENNTRLGFLEPGDRNKLATECAKRGLWMRGIFEVGVTFGWRHSEVLNLRVRNVDLAERTITLDTGTTKNGEGRTAVMTEALFVLLSALVHGKGPEAFVFTRPNGKPVRDFRDTWANACCALGLGQMLCAECEKPMTGKHCAECGTEITYRGLLFHDLRRTAVRGMVRAGIPERVAMMISGHKTRSVFERYNIVSTGDLKEAAAKMERAQIRPEIVAEPSRFLHVAESEHLQKLPTGALA